MPEYLAPGVYVEEISIGAKPIEGVSTSTAGFVGMTEKGPQNKPTLVSSFAEYQRIFGGYLDDTFGDCRFLPYAVEGFFTNGGQRAYISRVAGSNAKKASAMIPSISGSTTSLDANAEAGDTILKVKDVNALKADDILILKSEPISEYLRCLGPVKALVLSPSLNNDLQATDDIIRMEIAADGGTITQDSQAHGNKIVLSKVDGLKPDDLIKINDSSNQEICVIEIADVPTKTITIKGQLKFGHLAADNIAVAKVSLPAQPTKIKPISPVKASRSTIPVDKNADNSLGAIKIGNDYYAVKSTYNGILIGDELKYDHKANSDLQKLTPAIKVEAADVGAWGNRIKVVVKESSISKAKLVSTAPSGQGFLNLNTVEGIGKGTILKLEDQPKYVSVKEVIKTGGQVNLQAPIDINWERDKSVSTVEFDLIAHFDDYDETFKTLSLDEDHSKYLTKIITPNASNLITVKDVSGDQSIKDKIPLATADNDPGWKLSGGSDDIPNDAGVIDSIYKGKDSTEPTSKTGLHALENKDDISIAAIPGITSQTMQNELIAHCELMKDRMAVLDSKKGTDLDGIQNQRNLYGSKAGYAALYYPWISVFDPQSNQQIDVPPSGHICGIYARSDSERGVHKAPANEAVRGALDLAELSSGQRAIITKGQQGVLNPKGINCIRVFPGQGILVWGARTISSDPSWKYVNVRRLFLFIEKSIDQGTQWVVFEPNDEKLWARVKQTVTQFLVGVWKDGALMGTTQDDAFFVRCDRTTMTQSDIDNGRLIILVGIAPVKPAEFVIFRIAQVAKGSEISA